jgi:hypothetical protein
VGGIGLGKMWRPGIQRLYGKYRVFFPPHALKDSIRLLDDANEVISSRSRAVCEAFEDELARFLKIYRGWLGGWRGLQAEQVSKKMKLWRKDLIDLYEGFRDAFEEAGILKEFTEIVDNVNSTLIIAGRYGKSLPSVLIRTFVYDSINRLDDFVREYREYVGKAMDYVGEKLQSLLNGVLEETSPLGGE